MSSTVFVDQVTPVPASWLNDVNAATYTSSAVPALSALTSVNGGQLAGMRNRIINGDMRVAQRGISGPVNGGYTLDRWQIAYSGVAPNWTQSSSTFGPYQVANNLTVTGIASNTGTQFFQRIESSNCRDLAGQTVALSYYVLQTTGVSMNITTSLYYANTADNFAGTTLIAISPTTAVPTNTWTKVTSQFAVPSAATTGLQVVLLSNAPAIVAGQLAAIANVQLEIGSAATSFEQRPYGLELSLCQRYYQEVGDETGGTNWYYAGYGAAAAFGYLVNAQFPVRMRIAPTPTVLGSGSFTVSNCAQPAFGYVTATHYEIRTSITALGSWSVQVLNSGTKFTFFAEL